MSLGGKQNAITWGRRGEGVKGSGRKIWETFYLAKVHIHESNNINARRPLVTCRTEQNGV